MVPPVGSSRPSTSFAVVVFPQPDSPTTPRVCPLSIENEIPSTARTTPRSPLKRPRLAWKCLLRPAASRTTVTLPHSEPRDWCGRHQKQRASSAPYGRQENKPVAPP